MLFANCRTTCFVSFPSKQCKRCQDQDLSTINVPFITVVTLLSMMWVSFRISAAAIRASSSVNLSNRFSASSISFFPISFFRYFSEHKLATIEYCCERRTRSTLSYLLRCNREDIQHLNHDLHDYVSHDVCRRY